MGRRLIYTVLFLLAAVLVVYLAYEAGMQVRHRRAIQVSTEAAPVQAPEPAREVLLYFGAPDGSHLASEIRELPACREESDCLESVIDAALAGPETELMSPYPAGAKLLGVRVQDAEAIVDLNKTFFTAHPGGTRSELLSLYALADTLAVNFSYIRQIRVLAEGRPPAALKESHLDLSQAVVADFRYTRPMQPAAASEAGMHGEGEQR